MQRSSNPSSIKIQMNNFTLNLQTLLSKDHQQLPTTQRKINKTQRRTKSNFQDISPLKVKKKTKEKEYITTKNKTKKLDLFQTTKPPSKPSKTNKQKKQLQTSKKNKKTQHTNFQVSSKTRKDNSTRLQRHFTDYDHVIQSARLRTSPSQNYYQNFNSQSISKSASRSRSKSYKKIKNDKDINTKNKSRSKSVFDSSNNDRLTTQRSTSKIKSKHAEKKQKTQTNQKSTQKIVKKQRCSKSRQRKSIDNYTKKSKSRQRIYTQISQRQPLDDKHFNSDYVKQDDERIFMSHIKSKSKYEKFSDNLMSNSSEMGSMGPKFSCNKAIFKDKIDQKSEKKKKSKKVSGTASTTNIRKQSQNDKQKKLNSSKKLPSKASRKQTIRQKQTMDSQFNFYQSTNVQKKKLTQEESNEFMQRTTAKKSKKMKTQIGQMLDSKYEIGEWSDLKKVNKDEGWVAERAFKKKKKGIDIVDKLFNEADSSKKFQKQRSDTNKYQECDGINSGSATQRITTNKQQESQANGLKLRQFPQAKKLTIMTDFNPIQNKQIYFDDISKILLKKKKSQQDEKESMSHSHKSIRDQVMDDNNRSMSQDFNREGFVKMERAEDEVNHKPQAQDKGDGFEYVFNKNLKSNQQSKSHINPIHSSEKESQIQKIHQQDLAESSSQNSQSDCLSGKVYLSGSLKVRSQSSNQLDQLKDLNKHLQSLINNSKQEQISKNSPQNSLSSNQVSIKEEPSFGKVSPVNCYQKHKIHAKSHTLIQTLKNPHDPHTDLMSHNYSNIMPSQPNQNNQNPLSLQKSSKKSISSTFIRGNCQKPSARTPLCSPSSYAIQNKQKVISSLLNKPRKSVQEQFIIAKTLSNKRLLEELELLDTLEKIEKSVENSLIHEGNITRNYFGIGGREQDNVVEERPNTKNYQSNRQIKEEISVIDKLAFDNSRQEEDGNIDRLEEQLLLRESSNKSYLNNKNKQKNKQILQISPQIISKSPETMLLNTEDRVRDDNEDSPLLSNNSNEIKQLRGVHEFTPSEQPIGTQQMSNQPHQNQSHQLPTDDKQFIRSALIPSIKTDQLKVNHFQQTYEQIQNFFSNNSCLSNHNQNQREIKLFLNTTSNNKSDSYNNRANHHLEEQMLGRDQGFGLDEGSNDLRKKVQYSELTLEFEKEMDDYLKDHQQSSVKSKIQQIKANALKTKPSHTIDSQQNVNQKPSNHQPESPQKSDDFFYQNTTPPTQPHQNKQKNQPSKQLPSNNQLINDQMVTFIENKLLQEFCEYLSNHKQILHSFLFFISKCNLLVIEPQQHGQQARQQREINEEKFMQYLQAQIYSSNQYISNLGSDILAFVKRSAQNQATFIKNINKPFGILPLKTLMWMRKVYAEQQTKKQDIQESDDERQEKQQQNDEQEQGKSESMSGLSDCSQVEPIFPPTLLADFDAYQSQNIIEQMNQEQFYLNHAVYAAMNEICDHFRPFGENGYPVIARYQPKYTQSVEDVERKIMKRLNYVLEQRWGRIQFAADEEPEKVINDTYRRMDDDLRRDDDERWSERNMDDTMFENVYYLSKHIVDMIINQEVMEIYRMLDY